MKWSIPRSTTRRILISLIAAAAFTAAALGGLLYSLDNTVSDALYQSPRPLGGEIVVIGIDDRALQEIGPFQTWGREVLGAALDYLNEDPLNRPAAIGVDVLFAGETDPDVDAYLVSAAGRYGNVVTACYGTFGSALVGTQEGGYRMDDFALLNFEKPFDALCEVTRQGHINAMYDRDGKMRHAQFYVDLPDGERVPSFHSMLYRLYAEQNDLDPDIVPPTNLRHFWYLPYAALPGSYYDGVSVVDLLTGDVPADYFAGKIVLIGPYAAGLQDNVVTTIDPAQPMYGVEYQANAIDALLHGSFKRECSNLWQAVILFLLSFAALMFFWERKILPATIGWLILSGGWVGLCKAAYSAGFVLHVLWIPLAVTILFIASVALNYVRETLAKIRVTNTFKRYVAPEIVNEILREGSESLELGGKLTDIAVLFVDIRGFTPMSEILDPPQVVAILNRYLELTSSCIIRHGGTLDKFIGDATMAIWGAPLPQEDYIYKAVLAALDMVQGSKALCAELEQQYGRTVGFGIGIHCGKAVVGNIGAAMRMDFTAIGDTVNTAARLESNAPGGSIYISRAVAEALKGRISVTSLGDRIKLKGKADGFEILVLDGLAEIHDSQST